MIWVREGKYQMIFISLDQINWNIIVLTAEQTVGRIKEFEPEGFEKTKSKRFTHQIELEETLNKLLIQYKSLMKLEAEKMMEVAQKKVEEDRILAEEIEKNTTNMRYR